MDQSAAERERGRARAMPRWGRYVLAVTLVVLATLVQRAVWAYVPPSEHILYYPAVIAAAWLCGLGPGILAVALSTLAIAFWFLPPEGQLKISLPQDGLDLAIFGAVSLLFVYTVAHSLARARAARWDALRSKRRAEQASAARDQIVAIVSHDLKNPLHVIRLSSELIERRLTHQPEPAIAEPVARIRRAAERAGRLVADLLDVEKIDAGAFRLEPAPYALAALVDEALSPFVPLAQAKGIEIGTSLDGGGTIVCDHERTLQALSNLLANAVQYTPPGGRVQLAVERAAGNIDFVVRDTGPGMTPDQIRHAFDRFRREHRDAGGTGFGLFIARAVVDAHGGALEIRTGPGSGTTVHATLPQPDPSLRAPALHPLVLTPKGIPA